MSIKVDRQNGAGARSKHLFQPAPIHQVGFGININKNGRCPYHSNRLNSRNKRICDRNHFVAGANIASAQGQGKRVSSRGYTYTMSAATIGREHLLERTLSRSEKELHTFKYFLEGRHNFGL